MPTPNKNIECKNCGLLQSTVYANPNKVIRCQKDKEHGYLHDFGHQECEHGKKIGETCMGCGGLCLAGCHCKSGNLDQKCPAHFPQENKHIPLSHEDEVSLCDACHCMSHTIKGKCGKCKAPKDTQENERIVDRPDLYEHAKSIVEGTEWEKSFDEEIQPILITRAKNLESAHILVRKSKSFIHSREEIAYKAGLDEACKVLKGMRDESQTYKGL